MSGPSCCHFTSWKQIILRTHTNRHIHIYKPGSLAAVVTLNPSIRLAPPSSVPVWLCVILCLCLCVYDSLPHKYFSLDPVPQSTGMCCLHQRRRGVIYSRWLTESLCALWHFNPLSPNSFAITIILCVDQYMCKWLKRVFKKSTKESAIIFKSFCNKSNAQKGKYGCMAVNLI